MQLAHNRRVNGRHTGEVLVKLGREEDLDLGGLRRLAASITRYCDGYGSVSRSGCRASSMSGRRCGWAARGCYQTPRDRAGSFEPQLCAKRQIRLAGLDIYVGGMTGRDSEAHLAELYGTDSAQIKRDTISRVTDAVLADVQGWRTRPSGISAASRTSARLRLISARRC